MRIKLLIVSIFVCTLINGQVKMTEEVITLPTYRTETPDRIPLFYRNEEVQLAEKHIYPYPFYDVKAGDKTDIQYIAVVLENEFIKICVTPQMGGRLYYALDKTNGYDIVYNNHVVKPALIGTIGAWTSGGTEWNTPHHHRATSLIDVDYSLIENADGSKTVWVGEYEKRSQTRWLVGLTLEPGKAYVKMEFKSLNVTPYQYPALFFANNAVQVNDDYQFIFPPDVEMANFHYVTEFTKWPVPNQVFQSVDYTHGEDLSWWNAAKQPVSFFVTKSGQDFMGGIDHGKNAGIALVGDHRIFKGKKLWNWGKNEVQRAWDQKLTDDDGPYAELMMGFYSDNQPDYNFLAPFETKHGDMYLYGIKNLTGIKEANKDFAINLEMKGQEALVQINATSVRKDVKVMLKGKDEIIFEETSEISPLKPYHKKVSLSHPTAYEDIRLILTSALGEELIAWQKQPLLNEPFPDVYKDPLDPMEYKSSQDLFFAGLKIEQFGNTNFDYIKYYEAALALSPDDVLTNTQLGTIYLKRGDYKKAEEHLKRAVNIVTGNHRKAQDATSLYYLGVCYMRQGKIDEALEYLYRSTWDYEWTSAGYTLVAQLEAIKKRWDKAFDAADRAYNANTQNVEALTEKVIILRQMGKYDEARIFSQKALEIDPLCFTAMNELRLTCAELKIGSDTEDHLSALVRHLRAEPYNYIETASRYSQMGLFADAADIMRIAANSGLKGLNTYPMVFYHLGMYSAMAGRQTEAEQSLARAAKLPLDLCFPYSFESVKVLRYAISLNGNDAAACYLLGNALANIQQPEEAVKYWQLAAKNMTRESIIYRNIAYIQANHLNDTEGAMSNIMKAITLDPGEPRYFAEANLYMSYASLSPQQVSEFISRYSNLSINNVEIQLMEVKLNNFYGKYDKTLSLLNKMNYHIEEGASFNPHVYWFDANLQTGIRLMNRKKFKEAERYFLKAMEFPVNLEAERNGKIGIAYYFLGKNSKMDNELEKADSFFTKMVNFTYSQGWGAGDFPELNYYKALASIELGRDRSEAETMFRKLIDDGEKRLKPAKDSRNITVSVDESHSGRTFLLERELRRKALRVSSYYMQGLGYAGLGDKDKARSFFQKAIEIDPLNIDPKLMLESML